MGLIIPIELDHTNSVYQLKYKIYRKTSVLPENLKLTYNDTELLDEYTLQNYNIKDEHFIFQQKNQ